jgi:hypothetical protein
MTNALNHHSNRPLKLVRQIVDIVHRLGALELPPYQVGVDEVAHAAGDEASTEFDEALAFAVRTRLLWGDDGQFPSTVRLTDDGLTLALVGHRERHRSKRRARRRMRGVDA